MSLMKKFGRKFKDMGFHSWENAFGSTAPALLSVLSTTTRVRQSARACEVKAPLRRHANWCKSVHHVEIPSDPDLIVSPVYLKKNILEAVRSLFGEEGAKSSVDILKLSPEKRRFVLRCSRNSYVRLRASLTLSTKYEGKTCVYTVHRASPNLLSFTADSRTFQHGEVPFDSSPCQ